MGHYAAEMGHDELSPFDRRRNKLAKQVGKMSLGEWKVDDLGDLLAVSGTNWRNDCRVDHLDRLEKRLKEMKKK